MLVNKKEWKGYLLESIKLPQKNVYPHRTPIWKTTEIIHTHFLPFNAITEFSKKLTSQKTFNAIWRKNRFNTTFSLCGHHPNCPQRGAEGRPPGIPFFDQCSLGLPRSRRRRSPVWVVVVYPRPGELGAPATMRESRSARMEALQFLQCGRELLSGQ